MLTSRRITLTTHATTATAAMAAPATSHACISSIADHPPVALNEVGHPLLADPVEADRQPHQHGHGDRPGQRQRGQCLDRLRQSR